MTKIHKERIKLWIEDLRTTKAKQAKGYLKTKDGYCCLGRACEVYKKETGKGEWKKTGIGDIWFSANGQELPPHKSFAFLPQEVYRWFGFHTIEFEDGDFDDPIGVTNNNDEGNSFKWIADKLEKFFLAKPKRS